MESNVGGARTGIHLLAKKHQSDASTRDVFLGGDDALPLGAKGRNQATQIDAGAPAQLRIHGQLPAEEIAQRAH